MATLDEAMAEFRHRYGALEPPAPRTPIDTRCCLRKRRRPCPSDAAWAVTYRGEVIAFSCADHLSQTVSLLYRRHLKDDLFAPHVEPLGLLDAPPADESLRALKRDIALIRHARPAAATTLVPYQS